MFSQLYPLHRKIIERTLKNYKSNLRCISYTVNVNNQKPGQAGAFASKKFPGYDTIFLLPFSRIMRLLNRVKAFSTFATVVLNPSLLICDALGSLKTDETIGIMLSVTLVTVWLHLNGLLCNNTIVYIYTKDSNNVKLSYMDYWGNRVDIDSKVGEIMHLSDLDPSVTDTLFRKIKIDNCSKTLKLYKFGEVLNKDLFRTVFGSDNP